MVKFSPRPMLLLPMAALSMAVIWLSSSLPLRRAARIMPMSVLRDTELLRRAKRTGFSDHAVARLWGTDEDAVRATKENAELNGVSVDCRLFALGRGAVTLDESIEAAKGVYPDLALQGRADVPAEPPFAPADVVVANILGPLLVAFADEIAGYAKKDLVVSGILNEIYPDVLAAFSRLSFSEVSRKVVGEWTTAHLSR